MKVLAIHLPAMLKIMAVPVARRLAQNNPDHAAKIEEYHICFKTFTPEDEELPIDHADYVSLHPSRSRTRVDAFRAMHRTARRIIKERGIDVVTAQDQFFLGGMGYLLKREFGVPLNVQVHFSFLSDPLWRTQERLQVRIRAPMAKWIMKRADSFYVGTSREKQAMVEFGIDPERIWYMPYTIDAEEFAGGGDEKSIRESLLGDGKKILLLSVGRMVKQKDFPTLLAAMARVVEKRKDLCLAMVGDGPDRPALESMAAGLGLEGHVRFMGHLPNHEVPAYYRASDLVVVSSMYEGTCRVLLEAAASRKTVVATDTAGAADVVRDGDNGFLVSSLRDPSALAGKILEAVSDPARLEEMGARFAEIFSRSYSMDYFYSKFIDMLEYTMTRKGERGP